MSTNLFARFRALMPASPLLVCTVISSAGGSAIVELPGGARLTVRGSGTVGTNVFVRAGAIEGDAPTLPVDTIEV